MEELHERLARIEELLTGLIEKQPVQEHYSTSDAAALLGKAEFTVREWCRLGRVYAEKRACGRGSTREWMIAHEEIERIKSEGLLPLR